MKLVDLFYWSIPFVHSFYAVRSIDRSVDWKLRFVHVWMYKAKKKSVFIYASAVVCCILSDILRQECMCACQCKIHTVSTFILSQSHNKLTSKLKVEPCEFYTFFKLCHLLRITGEERKKKKYSKNRRGAIICTLGNYGQSN